MKINKLTKKKSNNYKYKKSEEKSSDHDYSGRPFSIGLHLAQWSYPLEKNHAKSRRRLFALGQFSRRCELELGWGKGKGWGKGCGKSWGRMFNKNLGFLLEIIIA